MNKKTGNRGAFWRRLRSKAKTVLLSRNLRTLAASFFLLAYFWTGQELRAEKVSFLYVEPGPQRISQYGHAALRVGNTVYNPQVYEKDMTPRWYVQSFGQFRYHYAKQERRIYEYYLGNDPELSQSIRAFASEAREHYLENEYRRWTHNCVSGTGYLLRAGYPDAPKGKMMSPQNYAERLVSRDLVHELYVHNED